MKRPISFAAISVCALLGAALWPAATTAQDRAEKPEKTELQLAMRSVMGLTKSLRSSLGDPEQKATALEQLDALQAALVTAKSQIPSKAAALEGDALTRFTSGYRKKMISMLSAVLDLEGMVLEDAEKEELQRKLKQLGGIKQAGHDAYK